MIVSVIISENNKLAIKKSKWVDIHEVFTKSNQLESLIQCIMQSCIYYCAFDFHKSSVENGKQRDKKQLEDLSFLISDNDKQVVRVESLKKTVVDQMHFYLKPVRNANKKWFSAEI
jgi:hypothetical protein